jgi:hypothetical protein
MSDARVHVHDQRRRAGAEPSDALWPIHSAIGDDIVHHTHSDVDTGAASCWMSWAETIETVRAER